MSMESIEKQHLVAVHEVRALKAAIEEHTGVKLTAVNLFSDDDVFCYIDYSRESHNTLSKSLAEMVAGIARDNPTDAPRRRLAAIDKERAELVAQLEAAE